jgi:REP element-mobilizing transposase RayT
MSTVKILVHVVFATKHREMTIPDEYCEDLYRYITDTLRRNNCFLKRINGIANHIHMLIELNPAISLMRLIQQLKHDSSSWIHNSGKFPNWDGWCKGYFACSVTPKLQDNVIEYIKNQKVHHGLQPINDEYLALLRNAGIEFDGFMLD